MPPSVCHQGSSSPSPSCNRPSHNAVASPTAGDEPDQNSQSSNDQTKAPPNSIADDEMAVVEGQSSLTAHSTFAIDFVQNVVGSCQGMGGYEISELLNRLRCIGDALKNRRLSSKPWFPLSQPEYEMPPLKAAVKVIQKAQGICAFTFCPAAHHQHELIAYIR